MDSGTVGILKVIRNGSHPVPFQHGRSENRRKCASASPHWPLNIALMKAIVRHNVLCCGVDDFRDTVRLIFIPHANEKTTASGYMISHLSYLFNIRFAEFKNQIKSTMMEKLITTAENDIIHNCYNFFALRGVEVNSASTST